MQKHFSLYFFLLFMLHLGLLSLHFSNAGPSEKKSTPNSFTWRVSHPKAGKKVRLQVVESIEGVNRSSSVIRFLGKRDQFFERQTRSRSSELFQHRRQLRWSDLRQGFEQAPSLHKSNQKSFASKGTTTDYVEDIPLGDVTQLNTYEYKFYSYFHRIRSKLEHYWGMELEKKALELIHRGRHIQQNENLLTQVSVVLNAVGEVLEVFLMGSSGVWELDQAAVESFRKAGPFPHPPRGMINQGRVRIDWGLVVNPR